MKIFKLFWYLIVQGEGICCCFGLGVIVRLGGEESRRRLAVNAGIRAARVQRRTSCHPGGAQALFADGAVKWLNDDLDLRVLLLLCTRDDGQVADGFQ